MDAACSVYFFFRTAKYPSHLLRNPNRLVKRDGACIIASDVQKWRFPTLTNLFHNLSHEYAGVAIPKVIGMCADRTDLGETGDFQPFTRHGYEFALLTNS